MSDQTDQIAELIKKARQYAHCNCPEAPDYHSNCQRHLAPILDKLESVIQAAIEKAVAAAETRWAWDKIPSCASHASEQGERLYRRLNDDEPSMPQDIGLPFGITGRDKVVTIRFRPIASQRPTPATVSENICECGQSDCPVHGGRLISSAHPLKPDSDSVRKYPCDCKGEHSCH